MSSTQHQLLVGSASSHEENSVWSLNLPGARKKHRVLKDSLCGPPHQNFHKIRAMGLLLNRRHVAGWVPCCIVVGRTLQSNWSVIHLFRGCWKWASGTSKHLFDSLSSSPANQKQPWPPFSKTSAHLFDSRETPSVPAKRVETNPIFCPISTHSLHRNLCPND